MKLGPFEYIFPRELGVLCVFWGIPEISRTSYACLTFTLKQSVGYARVMKFRNQLFLQYVNEFTAKLQVKDRNPPP